MELGREVARDLLVEAGQLLVDLAHGLSEGVYLEVTVGLLRVIQ